MRRFSGLAKKPHLKSDLHIHTNFSDGLHSVAEVIDIYGQRGFDTIAITDHLSESRGIVGLVTHKMKYSLTQDTFAEYVQIIKKETKRALEQYGMNVIFGYEITKNYFSYDKSCHMLILGLEEYISPELEPTEIINFAKSKNAIVIAAHPFHTGEFEFQSYHLWERREQLKHQIDAWEVSYRKTISPEVRDSGLPLIATSDFHHMKHLESWKTRLYCDNNFEDIRHALRDGQVDFYMHV